MSFRKLLLQFCLVISLACLAGGYGMIAPWMGAGAVFFVILALVLAKRFAVTWLPLVCLISVVGLAAAGLLEGAPALLMILSATAALASWDLMYFNRVMAGGSASESAKRFAIKHARSLAIALGLGFLTASIGTLVSVQIPFALMIVLVLVCVFSLDRMARYLENRGAHTQ